MCAAVLSRDDFPPGPPLVSIVIVTYQSARHVERCLRAVTALRYPRFEVIVVDNASTDGSAAIVRERFPGTLLLELPRNRGFAGGVLAGAAYASGAVLALLNPDTEVHPDWLARVVAPLLSDSGAGITGSKIYEIDGRTLQHAGGFVRANGLTDHRGRGEEDGGQYDRVEDVPYVTAAAMAVRRDVIARCGFLDPGYHPAYFEEADLCLRARRAGYKVLYVPGATLVHEEAASTGRASAAHAYCYHRNRIRFVLKTYGGRELLRFVRHEAAWLRRHLPRGTAVAVARAYAYNLVCLPATVVARRRAHV